MFLNLRWQKEEPTAGISFSSILAWIDPGVCVCVSVCVCVCECVCVCVCVSLPPPHIQLCNCIYVGATNVAVTFGYHMAPISDFK